MMNAYHIIAAVLFLVVITREGLALECIECTSVSDPDCNSNPERHKVTCPQNATSCRKMEQEIYYEEDYHMRTIRQCAIADAPLKCIERTGTYRFKVWYCHCKDDNCNGAGSLSISLLLGFVSTVFAYLIKL